MGAIGAITFVLGTLILLISFIGNDRLTWKANLKILLVGGTMLLLIVTFCTVVTEVVE